MIKSGDLLNRAVLEVATRNHLPPESLADIEEKLRREFGGQRVYVRMENGRRKLAEEVKRRLRDSPPRAIARELGISLTTVYRIVHDRS